MPAVASQIYIFAGIIPANPHNPITRGAGTIIYNDLLVADVLREEARDVQELYSHMELGVQYVSPLRVYLKYI